MDYLRVCCAHPWMIQPTCCLGILWSTCAILICEHSWVIGWLGSGLGSFIFSRACGRSRHFERIRRSWFGRMEHKTKRGIDGKSIPLMYELLWVIIYGIRWGWGSAVSGVVVLRLAGWVWIDMINSVRCAAACGRLVIVGNLSNLRIIPFAE